MNSDVGLQHKSPLHRFLKDKISDVELIEVNDANSENTLKKIEEWLDELGV